MTHTIYSKSLHKKIYSLKRLLLHSVFMSSLLVVVSPADAQEAEPFAATGHGAFFDGNGQQLQLSLDTSLYAQDYYLKTLLGEFSDKQFSNYKRLSAQVLEGLKEDSQDFMIARHAVLENVLAQQKTPVKQGDVLIKLRAINGALRWDLPIKKQEKIIRELKPHIVAPEVLKRLEGLIVKEDIELYKFTINKGQAYIDECQAAGVPIPPPINQMDVTGLTGWRIEGFIPQAQQFIISTPAQLRSYRSVVPGSEGMCYALPRFSNSALTTVVLDGVICLAKQTSKVCVWDNQMTQPSTTTVAPFTIAAGELVPIGVPDLAINPAGKYQAGGAEIEFANGGQCTDCHAGENPYIVHPNSILRVTAGTNVTWSAIKQPAGDLPTFSDNRYIPLVGASWPQNESSLKDTALMAETTSCNGCHVKLSAGRLPHLSNKLPGYCNTVLAQAGGGPKNTMPPYSPGMEAANVTALRNAYCNAPPNASVEDVGDPHITTVNGVRYDFQAAGEFTMLASDDGKFELQTRQTPVATTFTPGANAYTGLASCPSLNTAVALRVGKSIISYQPKAGELSSHSDLALFVNGAAVTTSGSVGLGGGNSLYYAGSGQALTVYIADGSTVRVQPNYWASQGYWYLDIHVDDTYARTGVMGAIFGGDWLPKAPDGSSFGAKPAAVNDRHYLLNSKFADVWRVQDKTSLFYYAPGTTTADFTDKDWPAAPGGSCEQTNLPGQVPFVKEPSWELAKKACSRIKDEAILADCILDVAVMGDAKAARVHLKALAF